MFDADGNGRVTTDEMGTIIRAFFIVTNDNILEAFLGRLDKDGEFLYERSDVL